MLEGKFKDKTHPRCGYPLWKADPVGIRILGTQYVAKCPRCLWDLPVVDVVDPDAPPEPEPSPETEPEASTEPETPTEPEEKPEPVKPDEIPKGMFWCPHCKALHRETSIKGAKHLKYLESEE
ncbi:hypothetical protein ES703_90816 [subsurface metagenome]